MAKAKFGVLGMSISGRFENGVLVAMPDGRTFLRSLPDRKVPPTAKQTEAAARLRPVAAAWHALSLAEVEAWRAYAKGLGNPHPSLPQGGGVKPYNAFTGLAAKCLQMRPSASVPSLPPTTGFMGDGISVVVQASLPAKPELPKARSGQKRMDAEAKTEGAAGDWKRSFAGTEACATREADGAGIVFSASGPNAAGVVTELLIQKLKSRNRMPTAKDYRTQRFVAFAAGSLQSTVPAEPGAYACAVRFVREATGQETALVPVGLVEVA